MNAERKRAENKKRRDKVHAEIAAGFVSSGFSEPEALTLVSIISGGSVPHLEIKY